jgi:hypothetical protein
LNKSRDFLASVNEACFGGFVVVVVVADVRDGSKLQCAGLSDQQSGAIKFDSLPSSMSLQVDY